jgi:hypothetical protein
LKKKAFFLDNIVGYVKKETTKVKGIFQCLSKKEMKTWGRMGGAK